MSQLKPSTSGSAKVFKQLRESIVDGTYSYNERLPSERSLGEQLGAARGTVRVALEQLEDANLVRRKFGSGTFACYRSEVDHEDVAERTSPLELIEARMAIEPQMVKLVVQNANHRDLNRLEAVLESAVGTENDPNAFSEADEAFHLMLASCSRNPLITWVYQRINDIRSHSQWSGTKSHILTASRIRKYNHQHRELLDAIRQRDQIRAADILSNHLQDAKRDLIGSE